MPFRPTFFVLLILSTSLSCSSASPTVPYTTDNDDQFPRQGWTDQPNTRGSLDILWSCGFTMFLCSWFILCLNVPAPDDTPFKIFRRKLYMTALGFLGPEFIFQIALGQWLSARRSVKDFHQLGYRQWTMTHAFYADMGGFILHTRDWTPFPVDAKQLHYLVASGYIKFPHLRERTIRDKNKVDSLLRIITLGQILWFIVDMLGRAVQDLAITCGELTTAAFIVCSVGTTLCWASKPADIATPEIIETNASIAEILLEAGDQARDPYGRTPLDFVSRKEWPWSIYWSNWTNILRKLGVGVVLGPRIRPVARFQNTISLELPGSTHWIFLGLTAVYSAIFICGWTYSFPTHTEKMLWRAASLTMMGTLISYWAVTEFTFSFYPALRQRFHRRITENHIRTDDSPARSWVGSRRIYEKGRSIAACIRNNSVQRDPKVNVPLKAILPIYVIAVFYCHARTYIFIADIIELRSLPPSAYLNVEWSDILPHI